MCLTTYIIRANQLQGLPVPGPGICTVNWSILYSIKMFGALDLWRRRRRSLHLCVEIGFSLMHFKRHGDRELKKRVSMALQSYSTYYPGMEHGSIPGAGNNINWTTFSLTNHHLLESGTQVAMEHSIIRSRAYSSFVVNSA